MSCRAFIEHQFASISIVKIELCLSPLGQNLSPHFRVGRDQFDRQIPHCVPADSPSNQAPRTVGIDVSIIVDRIPILSSAGDVKR